MISTGKSAWIDHIPAVWVEPDPNTPPKKLAIWLPGFTGTKENMEPYLRELAARGFLAVSFDPWQHGEQAVESTEALQARVFGNYRRFMWPIFGQTAADVLRVVDWALDRWAFEGGVCAGGISMGGVAALAAAGIDPRISRVAVIGSSPDWLRNGADMPPGDADAYSRFFYDRLNPSTHLERYRRAPAIAFECGADDRHVAPAAAEDFRDALRETYRSRPDRIRVTLHRGIGHTTTDAMWRNCLEWICAE